MDPAGLSRRRALALVTTVGLTGLAGCASGGPSETSGVTTDSTPTPTATASEPATATPATYPPGTSERGVERAETLVEATRTALQTNGYDVTTVLTTGSPANRVRQHLRSSLRQTRTRVTVDLPTETNTLFVEDGTIYRQTMRGGTPQVTTQPLGGSFEDFHRSRDIIRMLGGSETLGGILEVGDFRPAGTTTVRNRSVVAFELTSVTTADIEGEVTASRGSLSVAPDGVVFDASLEFEYATGDGTHVYRNRFTIDELGTVTVARPSWVDT